MGLKGLYINTMGCQMNVCDTECMVKILAPVGYEPVDSPQKADLIIANTCTIREKARQKAISFLGRQAELKKRNPGLVLAIGGCVAQQEGEQLFKKCSGLDLVFGTDAIARLPALVERAANGESRILDIGLAIEISEIGPCVPGREAPPASKFVTIMQGCDNYCTYCVVPYTRGREKSRPPEAIKAEASALAQAGVKEIFLLGQNVNSYGIKEGLPSFAELLEMIDAVEGVERIRFTTSHPKDFGDDLIRAVKLLDKVCRQVHLPVQSGSDAVLKRMNRKYTRDGYLEKVAALREACPGVALGTDMIAGFPGETDADFEQTLSLVREVEFDGLFAFAYSDRPGTPASKFSGKAPEKVKKDRLNRLLEVQEEITRRKNKEMEGQEASVLVEGPSKKASGPEGLEFTGRAETGRIVNFICEQGEQGIRPGTLVNVSIERGLSHSLWGRVKGAPKGDRDHAA